MSGSPLTIRALRWMATLSPLIALWGQPTTVLAQKVTVHFEVTVGSKYDHVLGSVIDFKPFTAPGSITFDQTVTDVRDYGTTTITTFGSVMGTVWDSPVTALLPLDPYSGAYGPFYNSYTFPNVSDYPSTFLEEAAAQANTYALSGNVSSAYHVELRATRRSAPRNGDGSSDYAFTSGSLIAFFRSFLESGELAYFSEYVSIYDADAGRYLSGVSFQGDARITGVELIDSTVPEPGTWALLGTGLLAVGGIAARQRRRPKG